MPIQRVLCCYICCIGIPLCHLLARLSNCWLCHGFWHPLVRFSQPSVFIIDNSRFVVIWLKRSLCLVLSFVMSNRFRPAKTNQEEKLCIERVVPKSTLYKNKWTPSIVLEWQGVRTWKVPTLEPGGLFRQWLRSSQSPDLGCAFSWDGCFKPKLLDDKICSRSDKAAQAGRDILQRRSIRLCAPYVVTWVKRTSATKNWILWNQQTQGTVFLSS